MYSLPSWFVSENITRFPVHKWFLWISLRLSLDVWLFLSQTIKSFHYSLDFNDYLEDRKYAWNQYQLIETEIISWLLIGCLPYGMKHHKPWYWQTSIAIFGLRVRKAKQLNCVMVEWHFVVIWFESHRHHDWAMDKWSRRKTRCNDPSMGIYSTSRKNFAVGRPSPADRSEPLIAACRLHLVTAGSGRLR